MATSKYNQTGKGNTLVGEHGQMINSKNTNSQIGLSPQAEEGFKKVAASVKKSKSAAAQKDLSSLKKEAKKKSPDKTKMNALWSGVVKAVPAVTVEVGKAAVDAITGLFT